MEKEKKKYGGCVENVVIFILVKKLPVILKITQAISHRMGVFIQQKWSA